MSGEGAQADRPVRLVILAGEPSGERQGAALFTALGKILSPRPVEAWGAGGEHMRAAGIDVVYDCTPWAAIGMVNVATSLPGLLMIRREIVNRLKADPPDVLVLIDAGAFNVPIGRWAKRTGLCRVFYYFPPGSWRRESSDNNSGRRDKLADAADLIVTPFPWSEEYIRKHGGEVRFVGHPSLDLVKPELTDDVFYERFGLDPHRPLVALLPGSRHMEIRYNLPALIGAAGEITQRIPGVQFALALAQPSSRTLVEEMVRREQRTGGRAARLNLFIHQAGGKLAKIAQSGLQNPSPALVTDTGLTVSGKPVDDVLSNEGRFPSATGLRERGVPGAAPLVICDSLTYDVLARSDLVITKSGTATLEATIFQRPMIIIYKGSPAMSLEWKLRQKKLNIAYVGMPNVMAGEKIFPELLADEATPEAISELAVEMLLQPERMIHLKEKLIGLVNDYLGRPGGVDRAAHLLAELLPSDGVVQ